MDTKRLDEAHEAFGILHVDEAAWTQQHDAQTCLYHHTWTDSLPAGQLWVQESRIPPHVGPHSTIGVKKPRRRTLYCHHT